MSSPIGLVAVFGASNFPLAFGAAGTDTASALAAGSTVIVKAHPFHPRTSEAAVATVRAALVESGWPAAALQLVHGTKAGVRLLEDPKVRAGRSPGRVVEAGPCSTLPAAGPTHPVLRRARQPQPGRGDPGAARPVVGSSDWPWRRRSSPAPGSSAQSPAWCWCRPEKGAPPSAPALAEVISAQPAGVLLGERPAKSFDGGNSHLYLPCPGAAQPPAARGHPAPTASSAWPASGKSPPSPPRRGPARCWTSASGRRGGGRVRRHDRAPGRARSRRRQPHRRPSRAARRPRPGPRTPPRRPATGRPILGAGVPTGLAVTWATHHGGPWPATTAPLHTSVGAFAVRRFLRPIAYQDVDEALLPLRARRRQRSRHNAARRRPADAPPGHQHGEPAPGDPGQAEAALEVGAILGEGRVWDAREQRLLFVDILGERVHWFHPELGTHRSFVADGPVLGAVVLSEDGGLVLARHDCFVRSGPSGEDRTVVEGLPRRRPAGAVQRWQGRPLGQVCGRNHGLGRGGAHRGALYAPARRLGHDAAGKRGHFQRPGLEREGNVLYYIDTPTHRVDAFDVDPASGSLTGRRSAVEVGDVMPDRPPRRSGTSVSRSKESERYSSSGREIPDGPSEFV